MLLSMQVAEGGVAPDFSLPSSDGKTIKLSQFKGKKDVVLFFYPASNTPGCTKQACSFSENLSGFSKAGAEGTQLCGSSALHTASTHCIAGLLARVFFALACRSTTANAYES
jgi:peroxiredoxin